MSPWSQLQQGYLQPWLPRAQSLMILPWPMCRLGWAFPPFMAGSRILNEPDRFKLNGPISSLVNYSDWKWNTIGAKWFNQTLRINETSIRLMWHPEGDIKQNKNQLDSFFSQPWRWHIHWIAFNEEGSQQRRRILPLTPEEGRIL